jgi:hypothetical protein
MIAFLSRHRVFMLFLAFIICQLLTWRAVVAVHDEMVSLGYVLIQQACGSNTSEGGNRPCHVVIDKPNSDSTAPSLLLGPTDSPK